jgi:D-sedoheptulose 7-phosphate isomerase
MSHAERFTERLAGSARVVAWLQESVSPIAAAADALVGRLRAGGTLYTCGNGGSAAEAMHLAEELIGRYSGHDRPPLPAVCLNADTTALTCIANDFGYEAVFARQCEALCGQGDVLVALSTSGNSPNIVKALQAARANGALTIGLLGKGGGEAAALCDHALVVDSNDSAHVQEGHLVLVHLLCEAFED